METLLNKIKEAGLDAAAVAGEEAIIFWNHVRQHVATTAQERAQSYIHQRRISPRNETVANQY